MPQPSITKICLKITYLKFNQKFPGANELITTTWPPSDGSIWNRKTPTNTLTHWPLGDLNSILKMCVIFNLVLLTGIFRTSHDNALRWMPRDLTDDKSTLVQVMAWCLMATSHYLSQCWLSSLSPYGITRPQWVIFFVIVIGSPCKWNLQTFRCVLTDYITFNNIVLYMFPTVQSKH